MSGTVLIGDLIGVKNIIFIKDENGLYTDDPKKNPEAEFISEIGAKDLLEKDLDDLVVERPCLEILQNSEVVESLQISQRPGTRQSDESPAGRIGRDQNLSTIAKMICGLFRSVTS